MNYADYLGENSLAVFLFHGVIKERTHRVRNYTRKHLALNYFREVLRSLAEKGVALSMDDIVAIRRVGGRYPDRAFAITFDDGFRNNYGHAAPLLKEMGLPAAFYVTTSFMNSYAMTWIDRIEIAFEHTKRGELSLLWRKEPVAIGGTEEKKRLLDEIRTVCKKSASMNIGDFASDVCEQLDVNAEDFLDEELDRKLSWEELDEMARDSLFTIGGHTSSHSILSYLPSDELDSEIGGCLKSIAENLGIETRHFSYPEGQEHCFNEEVIDVLRKHGVVCSPSAIRGVNDESVDLFHLHRINVT